MSFRVGDSDGPRQDIGSPDVRERPVRVCASESEGYMEYLALNREFGIRGRSAPFPSRRRKEAQDFDVIPFQRAIFVRNRVEKRRTRVAPIHVSGNKHVILSTSGGGV